MREDESGLNLRNVPRHTAGFGSLTPEMLAQYTSSQISEKSGEPQRAPSTRQTFNPEQ